MLATPTVPTLSGTGAPDLLGSFSSLPLRPEISPIVLLVLALLVGVFAAAVSVILVYHWRRFPFEHAVFRSAERIYLGGVAILTLCIIVGILIS